jgi:4-amino-4-deoxy-L-arabinose transferase-like glycosyltransferase
MAAVAPLTDTRALGRAWYPAAVDKWDAIIALVVGCVAAIIYGRTVIPGLLPGDGGEFQTLTYLLGNSHPTGYPVYLALARLFTLLPLGELAYRVNLFSAVMGALTVSGVYLCGKLLAGYRATAVAGALALAVSATLWSQSLIAEVYTAGAAFLVFILLALLWWDSTNSKWALFAAGLLGGLSVGVHMSVALLAPAVLLFLLLHRDRGWPMWRTAVLGAFSGLATTVLLFLLIEWNNPTASYFNSVIEPSRSAWGYDAGQMDGPWEHLLFGWQGRQFQYLMFSDINEVMPQQAGDYWDNLDNELAAPLIMMAVIGTLWLLLRRSRAAALLIVALISQLFYFFNYEIWDLYVFYIPSYLLLTLLAIAGLGALIDIAGWGLSKLTPRRSGTSAVLDVLLAVLVLAVAVWPVLKTRQEDLLRGEVAFEFDEYPQYDPNLRLVAAATVADLPENAIVFTDWDMMWPYYYTAYLENNRTDLAFLETYPADDQEQLAASLVELVRDNLGKRPMLFEDRLLQLETLENASVGPRRIGPSLFFSVFELQQ